jgi:acyl-CoA reductase-like NAD-dependent aldehyde dehydrogenase
MTTSRQRLDVLKTYKLYIDGKFPRSESGRVSRVVSPDGKFIANVSRASRKDFRDAVVAARKAFESWQGRSAYNRGQILYRIAETLEGRKNQFEQTLMLQGAGKAVAANEVAKAIDLLVYYAGWTDKFQQLFSSVNPVESAHFNFSYPEPTGVVAALASTQNGLSALISLIAPVIAGGNTAIVLASEQHPLSAIEFAEVIHASDLPAGVVNLLTGQVKELLPQFATHMDVNAVVYGGDNDTELLQIEQLAPLNVKRVFHWPFEKTGKGNSGNPYRIMDLQEIKTTWHPVGV